MGIFLVFNIQKNVYNNHAFSSLRNRTQHILVQNKRKSKTTGQSRVDNPETLATLDTQGTG